MSHYSHPLQVDTQVIKELLSDIPILWEGKKAIIEMKEAGNRNWRQMEWIGFYFQYLADRRLNGIFELQKPKYGKTSFDALKFFPWDLKTHAINSDSNVIIVNDLEAIQMACEKYGNIGLAIALGEVKYNDRNFSFKKWHDELKGKPSKYVQENQKRGAWSRLRKTSFQLKQIAFFDINEKVIRESATFQENFRNADGSPRRKKLAVDLADLEEHIIDTLDFA